MITSRFFLVLALFLSTAIVSTPVCWGDETESSTYAEIEPSLALVIAGYDKKVAFGTAFCIAAIGDNNGYLLTNKHVVQYDQYPRVILMSHPSKSLAASVVRASPLDAAVLLVPAACQPLQLSNSPPAVGTKVALAGFPSIQIRAAIAGLGLSPSFHEGTVSSILASGGAVEYDAQTDHGNSGSPLFDVDTGNVYGLVTMANTGETGALQNNFAVGIWALAPFLQNAHAMASYVNSSSSAPEGFAQPVQPTSSVPDIAGTYVGSLYDNTAGQGSFTVTILQDGKRLSGTWAAQLSSSRRFGNSGEIEALVFSSTSAAFYLISSVPSACPYLATVVIEEGQLRGTYRVAQLHLR